MFYDPETNRYYTGKIMISRYGPSVTGTIRTVNIIDYKGDCDVIIEYLLNNGLKFEKFERGGNAVVYDVNEGGYISYRDFCNKYGLEVYKKIRSNYQEAKKARKKADK